MTKPKKKLETSSSETPPIAAEMPTIPKNSENNPITDAGAAPNKIVTVVSMYRTRQSLQRRPETAISHMRSLAPRLCGVDRVNLDLLTPDNVRDNAQGPDFAVACPTSNVKKIWPILGRTAEPIKKPALFTMGY